MSDPAIGNPSSGFAPPNTRAAKSADQIFECARALAAAHGQSFTPIRRHVLKTLLEAGRPMTAYEVVQRLGGIGAMNAPTAYRALDFLEALGLIRKITSLRKYVVLRSGPTHEPLVFGICEACGAVQEIEDTASLNSLVVNAQTAGFATKHLTVELKGLCVAVACSLSKPA